MISTRALKLWGRLILLAIAFSASACVKDAGPKGEPFIRFFDAPKESGSALWSANCNRCHNAPSSTSFNPPDWDLVIHHMRLRANLTGVEARLVADFLKGGN